MVLIGVLVFAAAAPLGFQRHASPESVLLGEPFTYELTITHPKGHRYELKRNPELGSFELLGQERSRLEGEDRDTTSFKLRMALFALGKQRLPDLGFEVITESGAQEWLAEGVEVEGKSTLPPGAEEKGEGLRDIRPPVEVPVRSYRLLWALLSLLGAALLAYAIYRYAKRPRPKALARVPLLPLHQRTLAALESLGKEALPAQGRFREFHFRLSEILRGYLGERYGFEALESTSPELLDSLRARSTPGLPMEELGCFCQESDLVKFARAASDPERCKLWLELGYRVVQLTPSPPASPGTGQLQEGPPPPS